MKTADELLAQYRISVKAIVDEQKKKLKKWMGRYPNERDHALLEVTVEGLIPALTHAATEQVAAAFMGGCDNPHAVLNGVREINAEMSEKLRKEYRFLFGQLKLIRHIYGG